MHPLAALGLFLLAVFAGGALLAPWVYWLAQWAAAHFGAFQGLAAMPFHRYVSRCFLLVAVVGLWPFLRALGARSLAEVGLPRPAGHWRGLGAGFLLGFGSLAVAVLLAVACGARGVNLDYSAADFLAHLGNAALSAGVVALMEELFFRGALFSALRRAHSLATAVLVSSAVYALLHFLARVESPATVEWTSGLALLPRMLRGFAVVEDLVPAFFTLTFAGVALALARQRTGNLYSAIGLHAGWVFWLKSANFLTPARPDAARWLWGTDKLVDGWLALVVLAVVCVRIARLPGTEKATA